MREKSDTDMYKKNGFTMVEILIYVGITGMVLVSFVGFLLSVSSIKNKAYSASEVQANLRDAGGLISDSVRRARGIIGPVSGTSSETLILDGNSGSQISFSVSDGTLFYAEDVQPAEPVTSDKVRIDDLVFSSIGTDSVKFRISMSYRESPSKDYEFSQSLETSASLRKQ